MPNNWMPPANNLYVGWPYNQNMPYQQQQNTMQQQQQPINNILRVTGPESAKAYSLPPNSNAILFDADNPIFYLKTTDDSGFANLRIFAFEEQKPVEVQSQPVIEQIDTSNFATKDDLETLKNTIFEVKDMLKGLVD